MPNDSGKLIRIGIECEPIEQDTYGVARIIRKLLEQLAARPELQKTHRFILYFNRHIPGDDFLHSPLFEKKVVGSRRMPSFSLYYYLLLPLRLWWDRPDAMYWPNYMLPLINPLFVPSLVMLTEDIAYEMHGPKLALRYRLAYRIFCTWAAWTATRILAISHASANGVARAFGVSRDRIVVNELGVDAPQPLEGLTRTQPYLLYVGQAFERRHLKEALAEFERIAPDFPGLQFVFVGPDKYQPPLKLGPGVVHFERVTDRELALLYAHAQALVYVSDYEAFGLPPVEALAYGIPAVVADTPISREIFGEHAFYGISSLKDTLTNQEKRAAIRQAAPDIVARYTWSRHTDRFLTIVNEISHT